jgi:hypothetical protein
MLIKWLLSVSRVFREFELMIVGSYESSGNRDALLRSRLQTATDRFRRAHGVPIDS